MVWYLARRGVGFQVIVLQVLHLVLSLAALCVALAVVVLRIDTFRLRKYYAEHTHSMSRRSHK